MNKLQYLLKRLLAYSSLLVPTLYPTSAEGVERLAEAIIAVYDDASDSFKIVARRRVAESVLRGANSRTITLKLRFYKEIRMAMSAGAGFIALENIKQEEKAREQQREEASEAVVQEVS